MARVSVTELRRNMRDYFNRVISDREPLVVTRTGGKSNVVVISEAEFEGRRETVHLLSSPKNAERLMTSIRRAKADGTEADALLVPK